MAFDTTRLVDQIKLNGGIAQGRFDDQELLDMAYDYMLAEMVPLIIEKREEFYGHQSDSDLAADVAAYPIITRALGGVLRDIQLVHVNDDGVDDLQRMEVEQIGRRLSGKPDRVYLQGPNVVVFPTPDSGAAAGNRLRQHYFLRPSRFVPVNECGRITSINTGTNTVTLQSVPTGWFGEVTRDLVRGRAHFDPIGIDLDAQVTGNDVIFDDELPRDLAVGDYVTLTEESCFPALPIEGHAALVWGAVGTAMASMGHPKTDWFQAKAQATLVAFTKLIKIRVQGAQKPLGARFR